MVSNDITKRKRNIWDASITSLERQDGQEEQKILRARRQIQRETSKLLLIQFLLVAVAPALSVVIIYLTLTAKPYIITIALLITITDVFFIDRLQKRKLAKSAKLQEEYDCKVFDINWNAFVAGERIPEKEKSSLNRKYEKHVKDDTIKDWYPSSFNHLPINISRLACQIVNMKYDIWVRKNYRLAIGFILTVVAVPAALTVYYADLNTTNFIIYIFAPLIPIITWCVREVIRQYDTLKRTKRICILADKCWEEAINAKISDKELDIAVREIQSANYLRRSNSPIVFEKIYWLNRSRLEKKMKILAERMITDARGSEL